MWQWKTGLAWLALATVCVAGDDPIFDVKSLSSTPLNPRILKSDERDGIVTEEVRFHSETDGDKDVDIFAYFSYPRGARRIPAFIWNPGGLGQASRGYTEPHARRGYAVLCIDFPQPGYRSTGNYPINQSLEVGHDPKTAPIYHGAVALLKAVSFLQSREEVDGDKIGMAGASWGGFFTTLMVGVDPRIKVGSCLYGTGSLQLGNAWWDGVSQNGRGPVSAEQRDYWSRTLDPAWRLKQTATPIGWFTTTNDAFYSMPAMMQTIGMCNGPTHLTLIPNWDHAMPQTFTQHHVYDWLDVHLKGKPAFTKVSPIAVTKNGNDLIARWDFEGQGTSAHLIVSYGEAGNWRGRYWHSIAAPIEGQSASAKLPAGSLPCFISGTVISSSGIRSSTPLLKVVADEHGVTAPTPCPDYDGCSEWGDFEESQIAFLRIHTQSGQTRWNPEVSSDAKQGKNSAIAPPRRTLLPLVLSTSGIPHRFSCFVKACEPTKVTFQLAGQTRDFTVGTDWTECSMQITPVHSVMGTFDTVIDVSGSTSVLLDAMTFKPVLSVQ